MTLPDRPGPILEAIDPYAVLILIHVTMERIAGLACKLAVAMVRTRTALNRGTPAADERRCALSRSRETQVCDDLFVAVACQLLPRDA